MNSKTAQSHNLTFAFHLKHCNICLDRNLEDLKVLRRSSDLFNYVKICKGKLQLIIKHILFNHI